MPRKTPKELLQAIPLNPKTKRPFRKTPIKKDVIYGFKTPDKKIIPLKMDPQTFAKQEITQLQSLINKNHLTQPVSFTVFEKPTNKNEVYKKRTKVKIREYDKDQQKVITKEVTKKKGEPRFIYKDGKPVRKAKKLKVVFKPPKFRMVNKKRTAPKYRIIAQDFERGKFKQDVKEWRLQERSRLERLEEQILSEFIPEPTSDIQTGDEGYKSSMVTMRGKTLNHTLATMQPPDSYDSLVKQGYTSIGYTVQGTIEGEPITISAPAVPIDQYSDILNQISKSVRSTLLEKGKTFTKLKTFEDIREELRTKEDYSKKWKAVNTVQAGGRFYDMQTELNKQARGKTPDIEEIKRGDLKLQVIYSYYKGMK
jgi:hypothetical protein